jgi:hypothetical protein
MRTAAIVILFVAFSNATIAQKLTLLPQVGFENSKTLVSYNNLNSFAPLGGEVSPQAGIRLDYRFKQGFGPYLGLSTSRSVVTYSFTDPENGMNQYSAANGNTQLRFESGFMYSTKPLKLGKSKSQALQSQNLKSESREYSSKTSGSSCYKNYYSSRCSGKTEKTKTASAKNKGTWVSLQPAFGVAYIPTVNPDISTKTEGGQTTYEYLAGNWNTALITGIGFELGQNKQRLFNLSINYFKGFGNLNEQTLSTVSGTKTTVTHLQSDASGWNVRLGIPITLLGEKKTAKTTKQVKTEKSKSSCSQYKTEYRYRCRSLQ